MKHELDYFLSGKVNEECGVFGVYNIESASSLIYYGLHGLQHRGQEGAGIATMENGNILRTRGEGLVTEVFSENKLEKLKGKMGIGHVRYSTAGGGGIDNVQPLLFKAHTGDFVVAHNGNIVNAEELKIELEKKGSIFHCTSDSEIIGHLIQREEGTFHEKLIKALNRLEGAFSFLIMKGDEIYAIRDKNGLRPLSLASLEEGYILTSESATLEIVGGTFIKELLPGEVLRISSEEISSTFYTENTQSKMCAMEYIYFSRPDSKINNLNVHISRREMGRILAEEGGVLADIVIGVPDSSLSAAMGYAERSNIPYEMGLIKNRYIGRTFIKPTQEKREKGVKMKLSAMEAVVRGKNIVLIDDSIVRGTTSKKIVELLKEAGAKKVHLRIASPPIISPCFYGVDTSTYSELISSRMDVDKLCQFIGADSLAFLSFHGMEKALGKNICRACFTGNYPTEVYSLLDNLAGGRDVK